MSKKSFFTSSNKGFTLIELLVVISIIGILSTIVLTSLATARSKARDQQRISTMRQFANALELFYSANGRYPDTQGNFVTSCTVASTNPWLSDAPASGTAYGTAWSNNLISVQPHDPRESFTTCINPWDNAYPSTQGAGFAYYSDNGGQRYYLFAKLENNSNYDIDSRAVRWIDGNLLGTGGYGWYPYTYALSNTYK